MGEHPHNPKDEGNPEAKLVIEIDKDGNGYNYGVDTGARRWELGFAFKTYDKALTAARDHLRSSLATP